MAFNALVFTNDALLARQFGEAVSGLSLDWVLLQDEHLPEQLLEREHYDLVVVDARTPGAADIVRFARASERNGNCFVYLVGPEGDRAGAAELGADLVLKAPFEVRELAGRIRDCMPQMLHERRRHPRYRISIPVTLLKCEQATPATALNLSAGGMTVRLGGEVSYHEVMIVRFLLPGGTAELNLYGKLAWHGAESLAGIRFLAVSEEERGELTRWLGAQPFTAAAG